MRFASFIVAGLFAVVASAQSSTATTTSASAESSIASQIEQCLAKCDDSDTKCRANCIAVPSPDTQNVNATTSCVAGCPQGNGTAADNQAYADCVKNCIGEYYFTSTGTPNLATSGAGNSGGSSASVTQVPTTIVSGGSTFVTSVPSTVSGASASSSPSPTTKNAAASYGPYGTGLTLFGLLAGFVAL
ncbi:hypothetical protein F4860DRAFT_316528 [Xylaria cubensis]|nr:hypothetical protein F4860DRAFT_316528 [Xylaria cubensis]